MECKKTDLRIEVMVANIFGIVGDGDMDLTRYCGDRAVDQENFDSYSCVRCGEHFTGVLREDGDAWQEALEHVSN